MAMSWLMLVVFVCFSVGFGQELSCSTVKSAWRSKRLTESEVPPSAVDGNDLRICPKDNGKQCCSRRMEDRFASLARGDFDQAVSKKVEELGNLFAVQAKIFDDYFQELIKKSQQDLDSMFKKIYGVHYEQNTKLFMDFFVDLTSYYRGTTGSDINGIMDAFFTKLMGRMFQIMNTEYKFTESYLSCVSRQVDELRPFGEVPEKLKPQIRKVLIHARTFSKALFDGRDVIHMLKTAVSASENCKNHLVKLKYCSWCKAMTSLKPCYKFCTDVHKSCLVDITTVNTLWQGYIGALNDLLEKQTGPTNIQDVISRLNLKISLGIMNFQDSQKMEEVKKKVFQAAECGSPRVSKRSTADFFIEGSNRQRRNSDMMTLARTDSSKGSFDKLTGSFKSKMKAADNFWSTLPDNVCGDISVKQNSDCWNGVGKGSYTSPGDGGNDITEDIKREVHQAIVKLKEITDQLNAAINGEEILDNDVSGSASGSGSSGSGVEGSGVNEITEMPENSVTDNPGTNEVDDEEANDNMFGGGVGKPSPGKRRNIASQHHAEVWLLVSLLWAFLGILIA